MKLTDYKERDIPGWHEPNVTEETIFRDEKGGIIGAYFPEISDNMRFLVDYIIDKTKNSGKSFIPHVYGDRKLESIFYGGLRTDGSIGRHCALIAQYHKEEENHDALCAISYLSDIAVEFASSKNEELKSLYEAQERQQRLICNQDVVISKHFTSGSVNFDGLLGMHYDTASLPGVYNVILYRREGEGGNLIIPKYNICADAKSYSMAILRVKDNMHGVSAFRGKHRDCIVYYGVNGME